jgi:MFS family permease
MSVTASHPAGDTKNPRFMAFIVFAAIFMAVLDGNVVNIALPTITTYFGVDVTYSQWVVTAYLVTLTSLLLIFGRVCRKGADVYSRVYCFYPRITCLRPGT